MNSEPLQSRRGGLLRQHGNLLSAMLRLIDVLIVGLAGWLAHRWYLGSFSLPGHYDAALIIGMLLTSLLLPRFGCYRAWRGASLLDELGRITLAWIMVVATMAMLAYLSKMGVSYSRIWAGTWALSTWSLLMLSRMILRLGLNRARALGWNQRRILIAGSLPMASKVARHLQGEAWTGLEVRAIVLTRDARGNPSQAASLSTQAGLPPQAPTMGKLARSIVQLTEVELDSLPGLVEREEVDQVWLTIPLSEVEHTLEVIHALRHSTVDIRLVPDLPGLRLLNRPITEVAGLAVIDLSVSPMVGGNRIIKAIEDRVLALGILILVSPLMLLIAIGIKLDSPGPVIYRQERMGWNGRTFQMLKFRSMRTDADAGQLRWGSARDKPVTRLGNLLRRTSLDELPQFFNVLRGEMSIVGPRPERPEFVERFKAEIPDYMKKHLVKAGITGWAQVHGLRGDTSLEDRIAHDLYYIEHWSLWMDLKIMLLTVWRGFTDPNAR